MIFTAIDAQILGQQQIGRRKKTNFVSWNVFKALSNASDAFPPSIELFILVIGQLIGVYALFSVLVNTNEYNKHLLDDDGNCSEQKNYLYSKFPFFNGTLMLIAYIDFEK